MGLIAVDSSVWIDLMTGRITTQTSAIKALLDADHRLAIADLVLTEVLQGARHDRSFDEGLRFFADFVPLTVVDREVAIEAARHYRLLRDRGITVRKTIDTLIATRCILDRIALLYSDRDFDPFVQHLGLRSAMDLPGVT
ncbi:type II toxin-antitoxin system VapC family toxin [Sphingomonas adhaesiva]|uniref:type II toxin-antitoxin system VapC family toxin n=1 Tax=Sphingomonas adhaesiva TaxID=28212 RepID=UPI002FF9BDE1